MAAIAAVAHIVKIKNATLIAVARAVARRHSTFPTHARHTDFSEQPQKMTADVFFVLWSCRRI